MRRPFSPSLLALCLGSTLAPATSAITQVRQPVPVLQPVAEDTQSPIGITVAGGPVRYVPFERSDDGVPIPGTRHEEGPEGPRVIVPADANPYFLGFAAGAYTPPQDERLDPSLVLASAAATERGAGLTYAFAMFSKRVTEERLAILESHGARFLGMHPHYNARIAVPQGSLESIADLDFVRWLGVPRAWQKVHPRLTERLQTAPLGQQIDVWITVHESDRNPASTFEFTGSGAEVTPGQGDAMLLTPDRTSRRWQSNGWQHQGLEEAGVGIELYEDSITAFRAQLDPALVSSIAALDYVQFVELVETPQLMHEESQPMCGVDIVRPFDTGGVYGDAVVGEVDSGIEKDHSLLDHIFGIGWDLSGSVTGAWGDPYGHGTHVAGTFFGGDWSGNEAFYGAAPGLGSQNTLRTYNVKYFDDLGNFGGASLSEVFDRMHSNYTDFGSNTTPYPHIVSNSWGSGPSAWIGTEAEPRQIDNEVYIYDQLYTFAAGNWGTSGPSSLTQQASAKNAFSVGNVYPFGTSTIAPEDLIFNSSRGPCGDGRWKPNVVAPGVSIDSANSNDPFGMSSKNGTSMSTPHVSGIAALLVDRYDFLQYNPSTLAAVLMATAHSKYDHITPNHDHLDNFGAGRVSAYRAISGNTYSSLSFWGFNQPSTSTVELDFTVAAGATRITAVLTYHELAGSAGGSKALVQDVDMIIDRFPFSAVGNVGEFTAQISGLDNTEMRTIVNPQATSYRIKAYPRDVFPAFGPKVGVCVLVEYGDTTPTGVLNLTSSTAYAQPNQSVEIEGLVTNQFDGSTAQSVYLDGTKGSMQLTSVVSELADGSFSELEDNTNSGEDVMLGDMRHAQTRKVTWHGFWSSEGTKSFSAEVISPNFSAASAQTSVVVDGTDPSLPTNVTALGLAVDGHTCDPSITMEWDASTDALSGVLGYSFVWSQNGGTVPNASINTGITSWTQSLAPSPQPWYFHVRAVDKAGNAGSTVHVGPYYVGAAQSSSVCSTNFNSTGQAAALNTIGPLCLAENALTLHTTDVPPNQFGYYIFGSTPANVPFFGGSQGVLCIGAPIIRLNDSILNSGASGTMTLSPDLENLPLGTTFNHGSTWFFQLWFRDNNPGPTSNTSNGIRVDWD